MSLGLVIAASSAAGFAFYVAQYFGHFLDNLVRGAARQLARIHAGQSNTVPACNRCGHPCPHCIEPILPPTQAP